MKHDFNKIVQNSSASSDFIRYAKLVAASRGSHPEMVRLARGVPSQRLQEAVNTKASVAPGTSVAGTWGSALNVMATGFLTSLKPFSVFDSMLQDMARRPINTRVVIASSGAQAGPVAELGAKPLSQVSLGTAILEPAKVVSHLIISDALAKLMTPDANAAVAFELRKAVSLSTDQYFLDVLLTSPGVVSVPSTGNSATAVIADLSSALAAITIGANSKLYLVMPIKLWQKLSIDRDFSRAFVAGAVMGNAIVPLPTTVLTDTILLADAASIAGVSETIELMSSDEASVQMSDTPTNGNAEHVSLWQSNLVALRATRYLAAALLRSDAAVLIEGVSA